MNKCQHDEHILLPKQDSCHKIKPLVDGYILNCRCEAKSPATIGNYRYRLNCFIWFCQAYNLPDNILNTNFNDAINAHMMFSSLDNLKLY